MLASARDHYRLQQQLTARAVVDARKAAKRGPSAVAAIVTAYQLAAARAGAASVPAMLAEQGVQDAPVGSVAVTALAGVTSAGFPLDDYFGAFSTLARGAADLAVVTQVQDAGRNGAAVAIGARNEVGYVRMLNPPSCRDCIVLAGAWYRYNAGFERHPHDDCLHIPAREADATDLTTNPQAAFDALTTEQQDSIFGKADAEAIRLGADIGQVVRAHRGKVQKAQLFGHDAWATTEGATRRGLAGQRLGATRGKRAIRLMPETLLAIAKDREEAQRLLHLHGYIL